MRVGLLASRLCGKWRGSLTGKKGGTTGKADILASFESHRHRHTHTHTHTLALREKVTTGNAWMKKDPNDNIDNQIALLDTRELLLRGGVCLCMCVSGRRSGRCLLPASAVCLLLLLLLRLLLLLALVSVCCRLLVFVALLGE